MDVMMPKMDGFTVSGIDQTTDDARAAGTDADRQGPGGDVVKGPSGGADDYIIKPFAPRGLSRGSTSR